MATSRGIERREIVYELVNACQAVSPKNLELPGGARTFSGWLNHPSFKMHGPAVSLGCDFAKVSFNDGMKWMLPHLAYPLRLAYSQYQTVTEEIQINNISVVDDWVIEISLSGLS
jgi:hypothetical protein